MYPGAFRRILVIQGLLDAASCLPRSGGTNVKSYWILIRYFAF